MSENTPEIKTIQEWLDEIKDLKEDAIDIHQEIVEANQEYEQTLKRIKYCEKAIRNGGASG